RCVRVKSATGNLAFVDPSDDANRTEVELAPVSSQVAFIVEGLKRETSQGASVLVLEGAPIEIQAYQRPCWQICRESIGRTTIRLGGNSGGVVVTQNPKTPVCPVVGPLSVVIPGSAGGGGVSDPGAGGSGGAGGGRTATGGSGGAGGGRTATGG